MIEKVSFEAAMPPLRKPYGHEVIRSQYKEDVLYNSQTYILASLSGLAVIALGCLFGKKNINPTFRQVVNHAK